MDKDRKQDNLNLKRKNNEETLEIHSSGYGYEFVNKADEEQNTHQNNDNN
ncbi:hypothetical protein [Halalkalibacter akibai]|nr:hypothetical protein [Halalkalibacter akibai]